MYLMYLNLHTKYLITQSVCVQGGSVRRWVRFPKRVTLLTPSIAFTVHRLLGVSFGDFLQGVADHHSVSPGVVTVHTVVARVSFFVADVPVRDGGVTFVTTFHEGGVSRCDHGAFVGGRHNDVDPFGRRDRTSFSVTTLLLLGVVAV